MKVNCIFVKKKRVPIYDLYALLKKIVEADAYVFGGLNYYSGLNATSRAFLEHWFQFRHQACNLLWGKLGVAVGLGGTSGEYPVNEIEEYFSCHFIETVAKVHGQGPVPCFTCGCSESCQVSMPRLLFGEGVKVTEDVIPDIGKQPEVIKAAEEAGRELGGRLRERHDREAVAKKMQTIMMERFRELTKSQ